MNLNQPLVSVIMIVRNGERFMRQALDSVVAQTYQPIEIIVIDGQSTDQTAEIAQAYSGVRYIKQLNTGTANAYNAGIAAARGEYIAFLSHDDFWTPDKLSIQVGYLIDHPQVQYTVAHVKFFLEENHAFPATLRPDILEGDRMTRIMEALVARRQVFDLVGQFDPKVSPSDDTDWFARATDLKVPMAVIEQVLLHKRIHDQNTTVNDSENLQKLFTILRRSSVRKRHTKQGPESDLD